MRTKTMNTCTGIHIYCHLAFKILGALYKFYVWDLIMLSKKRYPRSQTDPSHMHQAQSGRICSADGITAVQVSTCR